MKHTKIFIILFQVLVLISCTKLDESFRSELEEGTSSTITADQLLVSAYNSLNNLGHQTAFWNIQELSSDEAIAPTRGPDWDDNGLYRALKAHRWDADHQFLSDAFNQLSGAQFAAANVLQFNPSPQQAAEARFIRALSMFLVLDGWDQVPYREDLDHEKLPITLKGIEASDFVVTELNAAMPNLPSTGAAFVASQNAVKALLMKVYLNKGVYANRATPTFAAADMAQVITLADQIIASNRYTLNNNFFDIFAPDNTAKATENIFTLFSQNGVRGSGSGAASARSVSHYNMNPGGWNGFATLSDFYDKFDAADQRRGMYYAYSAGPPNPGHRVNVGLLVGQQYDLTTNAPLKDRRGNPLAFTREVVPKETGNNLEVTGIRVIKYPYDYPHHDQQTDNDWTVLRYADVLLMKAEALLRSGGTGALEIVNTIRAKRGAPALGSITLESLLDERGREMYWEGWRRNDQIRFGTWLKASQAKPAASDPKSLLFPISNSQLAVNPNLTQNPGY